MYENDACAKALGIDIISMDEGFAVVTMTVTVQMLNGHQSCHGGQLFSLADTAFAYACNSQGLAAVASACTIDFLRPGFAGDTLTATAQVRHQGKQTGVYDIEIVNQQQKLAASHELHRRNGRYALCTMCIGVGQGIAMILERV
nr:hydroxyphenylacetyl-CoA thioesterase PaaI [Shigella dysenteriae]